MIVTDASGHTAHYVSDLALYDDELERALAIIADAHPGLPVILAAHSTGGLIHVTTAKPTDTPDGYFNVTGGSYSQFDTEGAYGGPITDGLRGRVSVDRLYHEGGRARRDPGSGLHIEIQ